MSNEPYPDQIDMMDEHELRDALRKVTNYPNLSAVLRRCVSGKLGEWPGVRAELLRLLESFGVPDSKPYKWGTPAEYIYSEGVSKEEYAGFTAGFNAARERKEG